MTDIQSKKCFINGNIRFGEYSVIHPLVTLVNNSQTNISMNIGNNILTIILIMSIECLCYNF